MRKKFFGTLALIGIVVLTTAGSCETPGDRGDCKDLKEGLSKLDCDKK